jgi:hypothetical protein
MLTYAKKVSVTRGNFSVSQWLATSAEYITHVQYRDYSSCFNNHLNTCQNNSNLQLFKQFYEISITLNSNVNVIKNKVGDYFIIISKYRT